MKNYIQIGAASGDDEFYHFFLKDKTPSEVNLTLVEPISHGLTEQFYKNKGFSYSIIKKCIVKNDHKEKKALMRLYSGSSDLATLMDRFDVPATSSQFVDCMTINELLSSVQGDIEFLFTDMEGLDREIVLDIDFNIFNIKKLYFEAGKAPFLDKTQKYKMSMLEGEVHEKLLKHGYIRSNNYVLPENEYWIKL